MDLLSKALGVPLKDLWNAEKNGAMETESGQFDKIHLNHSLSNVLENLEDLLNTRKGRTTLAQRYPTLDILSSSGVLKVQLKSGNVLLAEQGPFQIENEALVWPVTGGAIKYLHPNGTFNVHVSKSGYISIHAPDASRVPLVFHPQTTYKKHVKSVLEFVDTQTR